MSPGPEEEPKAAGEPVQLDEHRGMMAQKATELRRHVAEIEADQAALRSRQEQLERFLFASPAATWTEAVEKVSYLLSLFAATSEGQDPRRRHIIQGVLDDIARLSAAAGGEAEVAETEAERLRPGESHRVARRKATESARGKRQRGGGPDAKGPPRPRS
jgi:hypothetical protein